MQDGGIPLPVGQMQQQQTTASQGVELIKELLKERSALSESITGYSKEAMTPIAGTGPGTSPSIGIPQVHPYQPVPYNEYPTVGARATKAKNIGNAITAAANVVGQYEEKHEVEQQRVLAVDIERLFQAQDGVKQAQQVLQSDPNNANAKSTIEKNNQIIDALLSDPKKRKSISKALDISFTDPSKNDQMEHGALKKATDSYSQQFEKQTPSQMQPNIVAQQKLALAQAQQTSIDKMIGQIVPVLTREQGAWDRAQFTATAKRSLEEYKQQNENSRKKADILGRYKTAMAVAKMHQDTAFGVANAHDLQSATNTQALIDNRLDLLNTRLDDPVYQLNGTRSLIAIEGKRLEGLKIKIDGLTKQQKSYSEQIANDQNKAAAQKRLDSINASLDAANAEMNGLNEQLKAGSSYVDALTKGIESGIINSSPTTSPTVGPGQDDEDDNSDETDPDK